MVLKRFHKDFLMDNEKNKLIQNKKIFKKHIVAYCPSTYEIFLRFLFSVATFSSILNLKFCEQFSFGEDMKVFY